MDELFGTANFSDIEDVGKAADVQKVERMEGTA